MQSSVEPFGATDEFVAEAEARHESAFLSQNMAQKDPEKKMPSTAANAMIRLAKLALVGSHHVRAQLALRWTHGIVSVAWRMCSFAAASLMYASMSSEYILLWMFFYHDLEAIKAAGFRCRYLGGKVVTQVLVDDAIGGGEVCKNMGKK